MTQKKSQSEVTIVGGGFSGLAAALRLLKNGVKIQIVEKRPFFGGRAYSFREPVTGEIVDNGQHLLMGCYHETIRFLQDLGTFDRLFIQPHLEATFSEGKHAFHVLRCPDWPEPWSLAFGLWRYRGLSLRDKWGMLRLLRAVQKRKSSEEDHSVADFLRSTRQTAAAIQKFWEPIALGMLNESIDRASAKLFAESLQRSLLGKKLDSSLALSSVGLSELYAKPAKALFEKADIPIFFNQQVARVFKTEEGFEIETRDGTRLKSRQVLLALPPQSLAKLMNASGEPFSSLYPKLGEFHSSPIISINLWIENFNPPHAFVGLLESPLHWVFNKGKILKNGSARHVTAVISGAHRLAAQSRDELISLAVRELTRFFPEIAERRLMHAQVVKELDATFSSGQSVEHLRPLERTRIDGLFLCGDWLATGLPATIESAVTSGHRAAAAIMKS